MLDEKSDPLEEKVDPVEKPDPLEEKVDPVEKEELDPCKQVPSACAVVPAGQLAGSDEIDCEENEVVGSENDGVEKVVEEENEELDPLCKHVPSACADVPAGQLTGPSCAELEND